MLFTASCERPMSWSRCRKRAASVIPAAQRTFGNSKLQRPLEEIQKRRHIDRLIEVVVEDVVLRCVWPALEARQRDTQGVLGVAPLPEPRRQLVAVDTRQADVDHE